ncbi:MAG: hypothetical protein CM15mP32_4940 [Flavobacteriaceae bacterium]|nr:MAG: hypothetical protein CM15mP32_4940 [Flavobacteriaceae bacterium]
MIRGHGHFTIIQHIIFVVGEQIQDPFFRGREFREYWVTRKGAPY